jgi:hypothetical protein
MGKFSDALQRATFPWRLITGKTDEDKELFQKDVDSSLQALLEATKSERMGANSFTQGFGPAFRGLTGGDPLTPGPVEQFTREALTPEEQDYIGREPYLAALKSGVGMASKLMPFASRVAPAASLLGRTAQVAGRGLLEGAAGGFGYSREGKELQDTALGAGIGMGGELLGNYMFDPSYRGMVNQGFKDMNTGRYSGALQLGDDRSLVGVHNLTEKKLKGVQEIDGMPNPSVAVFDPEDYDFEGYGEISLIAPEDMLFSEKAKTFGADIYSPRGPQVITQIDGSTLDSFARKHPGYDFSMLDLNDAGDIPYDSNLLEQFIKNEKGVDLDKITDYTQKSQLREKFRPEFEKFANNLLDEVNAKKVIYAGTTPSGRPRYIEDFDAETISKMMNKEGLRGEEGFHYGLGSIRSKLAPEFRSTQDIKAHKDLLVGSAEFEKVKDSYEGRLGEITEELLKHKRNQGSNPFTEYGTTSELLGEYLGGDKTVINDFFDDVPKPLVEKINSFAKDLSRMPTEYFETKFQRPVGVGEFSHALVPEGASEGVKNYLKEQGVNVVEYTGSQAEALLKLVKEQGLLFGLGALGMGGLMGPKKGK